MAHAIQGIRSAQAQLSHLQSVLPLLQAPVPTPPVPEVGTVPIPASVPTTAAETAPPTAVPAESVPVPPSKLTSEGADSTASLTPTSTPAPGSTPTPAPVTAVTPTPNMIAATSAVPQDTLPSTPTSPAHPDPRSARPPSTQVVAENPYRPTNVYSHTPHPSPFSRFDPPVPVAQNAQGVARGHPSPTGAATRPDWGSQSLYTPSNDSFSFGQARFGSESFGAAARARQAAAQGKGGSFGSKARQGSRTNPQPPLMSSTGATGTDAAGAGAMTASVPSLPMGGSTGPLGSFQGSGSKQDGNPPSSFGSAATARSRLSALDAAKSLAGTF